MREVLWISIWGFGFPVCFAIGLLATKPGRKKKAEQKKIRQRRRNFADSITAAGERVKRELALNRVLKSEIKKTAEPIRKACGLFSGEDAQALLKKKAPSLQDAISVL